MTHFNIQINIQRVEEPQVIRDGSGYPVKGLANSLQKTERQVIEILKLAITADTEDEAYAKAHRMLTANHLISQIDQALEEPVEFNHPNTGEPLPKAANNKPR